MVSITSRGQLTAMPVKCILKSLERRSGRNWIFKPYLPGVYLPAFLIIQQLWIYRDFRSCTPQIIEYSLVYFSKEVARGCPTCALQIAFETFNHDILHTRTWYVERNACLGPSRYEVVSGIDNTCTPLRIDE